MPKKKIPNKKADAETYIKNFFDREVEYVRKDAVGFVDRTLRAKPFVQALKEERGDE